MSSSMLKGYFQKHWPQLLVIFKPCQSFRLIYFLAAALLWLMATTLWPPVQRVMFILPLMESVNVKNGAHE